MGPGGFFPTNPDLADILDDTDFDFETSYFSFALLGPKTMQKIKKAKSVLPKMSARSGLVEKNPPGPIWGRPGSFFAWAGKIKKKM